jgi:micrococcal nuclease
MRRPRISRRKALPLPIALVILAGVAWLARGPLKEVLRPAPEGEWRRVVRVVDGDTLELDGGERVRLIGVDTPESVDPRRPVEYFGKEAAAFTRRLAEGRRVRLDYDQQLRDRYRRTLAYVYLDDGTFLNAEIIRQGYGHALTRYPFRYADDFRAYEREARANRRGLWGRE